MVFVFVIARNNLNLEVSPSHLLGVRQQAHTEMSQRTVFALDRQPQQ